MKSLSLNESETRTIVTALMHEDTYASRDTLRELERQGVRLGAWVQRELNQREIVTKVAE